MYHLVKTVKFWVSWLWSYLGITITPILQHGKGAWQAGGRWHGSRVERIPDSSEIVCVEALYSEPLSLTLTIGAPATMGFWRHQVAS